ncbi:MAG: hypothetical protein ACI4N3_02340 [Alphaproteobacteria bacterium]
MKITDKEFYTKIEHIAYGWVPTDYVPPSTEKLETKKILDDEDLMQKINKYNKINQR